MSPSSLLRSIALLTLAATPLITAPSAARAQGLIDFLWGGTDEWGGKRQVIDFDQKYTPNQIIVSFGDRRLYLITQKGKAISYPIAVPREQSRWQGTTAVSEKKENPAWRPTPDMLRENPKLPTWVPGGHPMNPLGVRAIYLGASTYRIHGTDSPWTIGQAVSKGCVRMYNEDVLDLYPRVPVGMKVTVTWQEFTSHEMASNDDGAAQPFIYDPSPPGTSSRGGTRATRNMASAPPPAAKPGLTPDNVGFNNKLPPPDPSTVDNPGKPVAKAKPKAKAPETATAPAAAKSTAPAAMSAKTDTPDAAAAATKAAAAATRAAESARAAAEAAKKAAEDAKKATSADGKKDAPADDKHAAL